MAHDSRRMADVLEFRHRPWIHNSSHFNCRHVYQNCIRVLIESGLKLALLIQLKTSSFDQRNAALSGTVETLAVSVQVKVALSIQFKLAFLIPCKTQVVNRV